MIGRIVRFLYYREWLGLRRVLWYWALSRRIDRRRAAALRETHDAIRSRIDLRRSP